MPEAVSADAQELSTNVKETIESILVAFILAFIFRAFVVEAFVIPTGSMATTLLGAHTHYQCPDCGYVFDVDFYVKDDNNIPTEAPVNDNIYCPNCGYRVLSGPSRDAMGNVHYPQQPLKYGDRILVMKYSYLFGEPKRWDVVVFKAPDDPEEHKYTQNYIKRLVGRPGETLMVLDGSIYLRNAADQWEIQRRPRDVQDALWRVIYDNDYYPRGVPRNDRARQWTQPWQVKDGAGWNLGTSSADGRVFRFAGAGESTLAFNANAVAAGQTTNDYLAYDIDYNKRSPAGGGLPSRGGPNVAVSDLKVQFWYQRTSAPAGNLNIVLSKRKDVFTAEIGADSLTLFHTHPDGATTTDAGPVKLSDAGIGAAAPMWVQFANVDYRVALSLNGKVVLSTSGGQYTPDIEALKAEFKDPSLEDVPAPRIEISAGNQDCALSHISLWRNIYYTTHDPQQGLYWAMPNNPVHLHHRGEARENGKGVYDDDEYFVMGDNSRFSEDARYWMTPIILEHENLDVDAGRVPGRFILGKAFFVYWPAGYRAISWLPALIPDFGDMRFIH